MRRSIDRAMIATTGPARIRPHPVGPARPEAPGRNRTNTRRVGRVGERMRTGSGPGAGAEPEPVCGGGAGPAAAELACGPVGESLTRHEFPSKCQRFPCIDSEFTGDDSGRSGKKPSPVCLRASGKAGDKYESSTRLAYLPAGYRVCWWPCAYRYWECPAGDLRPGRHDWLLRIRDAHGTRGWRNRGSMVGRQALTKHVRRSRPSRWDRLWSLPFYRGDRVGSGVRRFPGVQYDTSGYSRPGVRPSIILPPARKKLM